jgi:hypothetical protein
MDLLETVLPDFDEVTESELDVIIDHDLLVGDL